MYPQTKMEELLRSFESIFVVVGVVVVVGDRNAITLVFEVV